MVSEESYKDYCNRFNILWSYLQVVSYEVNSVINKLCEMRGYSLESNMSIMLKKIGFIYVNPECIDLKVVKALDKGDLGLFSEKGDFLFYERFVFPVRDMLGNIIALIGWFPDGRKYITTPSRFFSKKCCLFGLEQLKYSGLGKQYFLTEGIFDCISMRAIGKNCVALMGIDISSYTEVLYSLFRNIIAIPDSDAEGRKVVNYDKWKLPTSGKYMVWSGDNSIKDIDDLLKKYDMEGIFEEVAAESDRVVKIQL